MDDVLKIENLSFSYGKKQIINDCSCQLKVGRIYVLLGKNGVGKTTLFKCILKQNPIQEETIYIFESDITKLSIHDFSRKVAYVPQLSSMENYDILVRDYLVQGRTPYIKTFGVPSKDDYIISLKYSKLSGVDGILDSSLSELSGGQLQMVNITRALVQETPLIVMDEPLSALDIPNQIKVLSLIEELASSGKTILLSSHNPNHAIYLNADVLLMKDGCFLACGSSKMLFTSTLLSKTYCCDVNVYEVDGKKIISI